jgi:MoaA/NifB/PqqE/SkfB family radical SAM enzyme
MNEINLPEHYNYIGIFLSLGCNLTCSYCINHTVGLNQKRKHLSAKEWIEGLNRLDNKKNIPISLQGGEPTIHPGIYEIINGLENQTDLLTNLQFNVDKFAELINPNKFSRDLPYPAIRVSYHPETMDFLSYAKKLERLHHLGYSIGFFSVDHPKYTKEIEFAKEYCNDKGLFFKTKELLADYEGKIYGKYKYENSCFSKELKTVQCKTSELLIAPEGDVFRCHHDLYNKKMPIGNILDPDFNIDDKFRTCEYFGQCNPCDVKVKNNRFQQFGHCSVEIKAIS